VNGRSFLITSTFRTYYSRLVTIRMKWLEKSKLIILIVYHVAFVCQTCLNVFQVSTKDDRIKIVRQT